MREGERVMNYQQWKRMCYGRPDCKRPYESYSLDWVGEHGVKGISRTGRKTRYYTRSGHSTGQMPVYRFMDKAEESTANGVEERLFRNLEANVDKAARKNGLL